MIMTCILLAIMILISTGFDNEKYSLVKKIDTTPVHSINRRNRVYLRTVSTVTQGNILRIVWERFLGGFFNFLTPEV